MRTRIDASDRRATPAAPLRAALLSSLLIACTGAPAQEEPEETDTRRSAESGRSGSYAVTDLEGNEIGTLELEDGGRGLVIRVRVDGLSTGGHGFHLHETGRCEPPFESAGGHHAPRGRTHGFLTEDGPHLGDLPNLQVAAATATAEAHAYAAGLTLDDLLDEDGSAMIIHAGPDDYVTDPAGAAGDRVACAAITGD